VESIEIPQNPIIFICHFAEHDGRMPAFPYYQCYFDPNDPDMTSPSGEFIRFRSDSPDPAKNSEIHGWRRISDIVIDEIMREFKEGELTDYEKKQQEAA